MIVVSILSIFAVIATPNSPPSALKKLDIATQKVALAIRFARLEAIRTDKSYGLFFDANTDTAKVYRLLSGIATYDIYHPIDKKIYTLNLKTDRATEGVEILSYSINFQGISGNKQYLGFSEQGVPKYHTTGTVYMLSNSASITLSYAGQTRDISVSPMVGRVTVSGAN